MVSNVHPPFMRVCVRASVYVCVYAHLIFCVIPFLLGAQSFVHGDSGLQTGVPACHSGFRTTFKSTPSQMNPPKNEISTVIIKYVHGRVTVDVNLHSSDTWTRCIDVENVVLNDDGYYFGVTASTGDLSDNHDLHSITIASKNAKITESTVETKAEMIAKEYEDKKEMEGKVQEKRQK